MRASMREDATKAIQAGDVIQLDPAHSAFGPILAVVDEVHPTCVFCYFWLQMMPGNAKPQAIRTPIQHGAYARIGAAKWGRPT